MWSVARIAKLLRRVSSSDAFFSNNILMLMSNILTLVSASPSERRQKVDADTNVQRSPNDK